MARAIGVTDARTETKLALAMFQLGQLDDARGEAERLTRTKKRPHGYLAYLWFAIGDRERAHEHAMAAYTWARADGKPYVHCYELDKARTLIEELGAEIPRLGSYDSSRPKCFFWEHLVAEAIEKLRERHPHLTADEGEAIY